MAEVTLNTLSQSSNKDKLACEKQSGKANDMSEQNKPDGQLTKKKNEEQHSNHKEEDSSDEDSSSSSLEDENPITQDKEFKKPMKPMMSINVMTRKQKLLALRNTPPHDPGKSKQQE
eukprot:2743612-Ditylum_brightwellii.AAC.1